MSQLWLYVLEPVRPGMVVDGPNDLEMAAIGRHGEHLNRLAEEGVLVFAGRTQVQSAETRGYALLWADDEAAATRLMNSDPAVSEGIMRATLWPYAVAVGNAEAFKRALEAE